MDNQNPEEGRIDAETAAILLRGARQRTLDMKRQLRENVRRKASKERAQRWMARHEPKQMFIIAQIGKQVSTEGPQNRLTRRRQAKMMNVFKTKNGWQDFTTMYRERFGYQQSISRKKLSKGSIVDAMEKGAVV